MKQSPACKTGMRGQTPEAALLASSNTTGLCATLTYASEKWSIARQDFVRATREASQKIKERTVAFAAATGIRGLHLALDSHLRESRMRAYC